jgi:CubicO group peptidase (beta-lactamase class C family)
LDEIAQWLRSRLPELTARYGVPGVAVAVSSGDDIVDVAVGVLNTGTGVEADADSIFQIGSITKVLTASLVLQLRDEGRIELDSPIRRWLPEFRVADERAAAAITVRQLLCHVSGFEGDVFTDTGKGDDCVEKYLTRLRDVPQLFPPGEMWSYNNAGYCVLGRLVEVVRGKPYDRCLREHLLAPLGMRRAATDPYEAVLHRVAVGHVTTTAGPAPTETWALARSNGPAGSMLAMRARDLLAFARMHLAEGRAADETAILSAASVRAMQEPQIQLPDIAQGVAWGLGWELFSLAPRLVFGHDGSTIGQSASLRVVPDRDVALVVLANGGEAKQLQRAVAEKVLGELADVSPPEPPVATGQVRDARRYVGRYVSAVSETAVTQDADGRLWLDRVPRGELADLDEPPYRTELAAWRGDSFLPITPEDGVRNPLAFLGDDGDGRAAYLHTGRADRRIG